MLRRMSRSPRLLALSIVAGLLTVCAAAAAQMTQGPPTPIATDLTKVSVGSWAKYNMTMGTLPAMTMKMALVGRSPEGVTLEMSAEGGITAAAGAVITQWKVPTGSGGKVEKIVLQVGPNDPMEMPIPASPQFAKPDPKKLVKEEKIKVAGGSYKTKHYRDKTAEGDTVDYWVAESASPLGLVKMEATQKNNQMLNGPIKMELASMGKDAKQLITKAPKPFDQATLVKEMMGGSGAAPAGAGAPPAK
jgi:hypothetical protein